MLEDVKLWASRSPANMSSMPTGGHLRRSPTSMVMQRVAGGKKTPFDGAVPLAAVLGLRHFIADWESGSGGSGTLVQR